MINNGHCLKYHISDMAHDLAIHKRVGELLHLDMASWKKISLELTEEPIPDLPGFRITPIECYIKLATAELDTEGKDE